MSAGTVVRARRRKAAITDTSPLESSVRAVAEMLLAQARKRRGARRSADVRYPADNPDAVRLVLARRNQDAASFCRDCGYADGSVFSQFMRGLPRPVLAPLIQQASQETAFAEEARMYLPMRAALSGHLEDPDLEEATMRALRVAVAPYETNLCACGRIDCEGGH